MFKTSLSTIIACFILVFFCLINVSNSSEQNNISQYLKEPSTRTISMDFKDAQLSNVLKIFSQQSGLNFISATSVSDKEVNLYLDNVPVEEALERILSANNLTYEMKPQSNIFIVKDLPNVETHLMTRIYKLKYATVSNSKLNKTLSEFEGSDSSSDDSSKTQGGIVDTIKALLTKAGSVIEDARTNSLIITDIPSQFPMIEQTISTLDVRIPLVLIDVEMLDISTQAGELLGIKFGNTPITFKGAEYDSIYPFNKDNALDDGHDIYGDSAPYRLSTLSFAGLTFSLQFLRTQTDTKTLARPRILTLNNETAEIRIKTDEAIGVSTTTTASEGTSNSVNEAERVETGVFLKVTPQANILTGEITMAIEPKVIEARTGGTFGSQTFKDPEERGSKSILRIKNGETIVIGGLLRSSSSDIKTKVPILEKIPFLGQAFRHKNTSKTDRELIIFITPSLIEEADENKYLASSDIQINQAPLLTGLPSRFDKINKELHYFSKKDKYSIKSTKDSYRRSFQRIKKINDALSVMEKQGF